MNILILHHFSDSWDSELEKYNTSYLEMYDKVKDFIKHNNLDKIILPLFGSNELQNCHMELAALCLEKGIKLDVTEYNYAWSKESDPDNEIYTEDKYGITWCYGKRDNHDNKNDVVEIEKWQWDLIGNNIFVAGCFDNQCINDLETALNAIKCPYERIDGLIVGSGVEYEMQGLTQEQIVNQLEEKIERFLVDEIVSLESDYQDNNYDEVADSESYDPDMDDLFQLYPEKIKEFESTLEKIFSEYDMEELWYQRLYTGSEIINNYVNDYILEQSRNFDYYSNEEEPLMYQLKKELHDLKNNNDIFICAEEVEEDKDFFKLEESEIIEAYNNLKEIFKNYKSEDFVDDVISSDSNTILRTLSRLVLNESNINLFLNIVKIKNSYQYDPEIKYYHGTVYNKSAEDDFSQLDENYGNLNVCYVTEDKASTLFFAEEYNDSDNGIPVILECEIKSGLKLFLITPDSSNYFKFKGTEYSVAGDREDYFEDIKNEGFDGAIIIENYNNGGSDIAIFKGNNIEVKGFYYKKDDYTNLHEIENMSKIKQIKKIKQKI